MSQASRTDARTIFEAAVAAVVPKVALASADLSAMLADVAKAKKVLVIGGGKAGAGMVRGLETLLSDRLDDAFGLVNVPDDLVGPTLRIQLHGARPAGRNEPTPAAQRGAEQMLQLVAAADGNTAVIVLLSGGGSALLPVPVSGITLADKLRATQLLSRAGASIEELNCLRKHLSRIKGGRLAEAGQHAATIWTLIISDVVGDPLDVIASGPTSPDRTTRTDALAVIEKYGLAAQLPAIVAYLRTCDETPKTIGSNVHHQIIANNHTALMAAATKARALNYDITVLEQPVVGDVASAATDVFQMIQQLTGPRQCLLFGGETTVNVGSATGLGGRNQALALTIARDVFRNSSLAITVLCGGTDGEDGPTDAAGGLIDGELWQRGLSHGQSAERALANHDAYHFLKAMGGLLTTGPTGTNVMDIGCVLVGE
jgi:hydroxypyruvate reductase/glycerate 2-kinase